MSSGLRRRGGAIRARHAALILSRLELGELFVAGLPQACVDALDLDVLGRPCRQAGLDVRREGGAVAGGVCEIVVRPTQLTQRPGEDSVRARLTAAAEVTGQD